MVIEKVYLVTLKGELVNAYYRAGYTDEDIAKFWNEEIAKQIAEAVHIRLQAPSALKVEARPVKRGKWNGYICSECNEYADYFISGDFYFDEKPTFCPNCGARMDGEP